MATGIVIESQYIPPISYFALLVKGDPVTIDVYEHFVKGTYRNRCHICGANGLLRLSVQLEKGKHQRRAMNEVTLSYEHNWQRLHWQSIEAAYRRSPYFEYYEDDFYPLFERKYDSLVELNDTFLNWFIDTLALTVTVLHSKAYVSEIVDEHKDMRSSIHPNPAKSAITFTGNVYEQVFANKLEFIPDLSILDLLFNLGPRAKDYLLKMK